MRYIHSQEELEIPDGGISVQFLIVPHNSSICTLANSVSVKVGIKSRVVTVEGPRGRMFINWTPNISLITTTGKLTKDLSHLSVNFSQPSKALIHIELHHGARKNVATLRTVKTLINNLIIGVTKGFKYKMRYVYAHFPINLNIEKNSETGLYEVDIRYESAYSVGSDCVNELVVISWARRSYEESRCSLEWTSRHRRTRRMRYS